MEDLIEKNQNKHEDKTVKQNFLSSAISDISSYIHLSDTKVSILMAAIVAIIVGIVSIGEEVSLLILKLKPCSWLGVVFIICLITSILSLIAFFVFALLTLRGHSSIIDYPSRWFLSKRAKYYSFDAYLKDVCAMSDDDCIDNMAAELYKLNDIYQQKARTKKWTLRAFSLFLITIAFIALILIINIL